MKTEAPEPAATEQPEDTRSHRELATAIESLRMRGLAPATTLGVDLNALSRDELLALEAKAKQERSEMDAAHAASAVREQAHYDATHQSREQMLEREAEWAVSLRAEQHRIAREHDARRHWIRPTAPAPEPPMAA